MAVATPASLNYHHLHYFYRVAKAGGIASAARELRISHSTLSVQIRELGEALGGPLFRKQGRGLVLTPRGEETLAYAEEIFRLGTELVDVTRDGRETRGRGTLRIGLVPGVPRSLGYKLLGPALSTHEGPFALHVDSYSKLIEELAAGRLHAILTDAPPPEGARMRAYVHALGASGIGLYGTGRDAMRSRRGFPGSLEGAPLVVPAPGSSLRRLLDRWLAERGVRPEIVAEVDDAALLRVVGVAGVGAFPVRLALRAEVDDVPGLVLIGRLDGLVERYYVISMERRVRHPAIVALVVQARAALGPA